MVPDYDTALAFLRSHNESDSLVKHGIAVGAAMKAYARKFGEDEAAWQVTGLLHDVDYEKHPTIEEHGKVGADWLKAAGYPDDMIYAVHAHNDYFNMPRHDQLSRALFACDELAGLITACALVRPTKSLEGLEAASVRKKMRDKAFARGVNRDDILKGVEELGVDLNDHITFVIAAMQTEAPALGLAGQ